MLVNVLVKTALCWSDAGERGPAEQAVHRVRRLLPERGQNVGVEVHGRSDHSVAENLLDHLHRHALRQEEARAAVAEAVKLHAVNASRLEQLPQAMADLGHLTRVR